MKDLFFWLRWKSSYQILYVTLLVIFLASIAAAGIASYYGDLYTIGWDTTGEWKNITLGIDSFDVNQFSITQESQQYLLQQRYVPGNVTIHPWISYAYLGIILLAFVILLAVISYLNIWMYVTGMALFLFFLVTMHTEQLGIFGMYNRVPVAITIILFSGLTYYFNAYGKHISLFIRLTSLSVAAIMFVACMQFGSSIDVPLLYASNYSIAIPILLSILFMFLVGYDIIQALVLLTSYGRSEFKTSGNGIWNFIIIGTLYLINLYLVYFKPAFLQGLDIAFLQPFVILALSAIAGIWMFPEKKEIASVLPFQPLGAILFLALGIITFATIALGYATANDAFITTLEKAALYIEIGMGLAIFLYVILNFWKKYKKQEEVYKQFYITYQVPYFVGRSVGWVIAAYFFFSSNMFIYYSGLAAYYNHVGDVYLYTQQDDLATSHYRTAYSWEFQNQRTCYTLGNLYQQKDDRINAFTFYEGCLYKKPTVYAYTALSSFYITNDQFFPAMFMLQDGLKAYPKDPQLLNNLGYLYTRISDKDSAAYYYDQALLHTEDEIPAANLLSYYAQKGNFAQCDTIIQNYSEHTSHAYLANKIGVHTMSGIQVQGQAIPATITSDSLADAYSFTFLYNYTFSRLNTTDTSLHVLLDRYIRNPENVFYKPNLMYAKAIQLYYSQTNVPLAFQLLEELVQTESAPLYIITLADWQLKGGLYQQAYETYRLLTAYPDQRMVAYRCIAAYESDNKNDVYETLLELSKSQIHETAVIANTLLKAQVNPSAIAYETFSDKEKVQCLHYHESSATHTAIQQLIQDPKQLILLRIQSIHDLNDQQQYAAAMNVWNKMKKPEGIPAEIIALANLEYLHILAGLSQWNSLAAELKQTTLLKQDLGYIDYFNARILQHSADSAQALPYYQRAIAAVGYDAQVQVDYALYTASIKDDMQALEQLVEAKKIIQYSKPISVAYIDMCIRLGLYKSAEDELNSIAYALSKDEIVEIKNKFFTGSLPE